MSKLKQFHNMPSRKGARISTQRAVSNLVFVSVVAILLITTGLGFGLYATKQGINGTTTVGTTLTHRLTTTVVSTSSVSSGSALPHTPGFFNGTIVTFSYPKNFNCTPSLLNYFANQTAAASKTQCEVGAGNSKAESGAVPLWVVVPAYAGLSIFGVQALGASSQGFATFENQTIVTDCGAGGTVSACPDHPTFLYSPFFTAVEQHIGISNGYGGLPEGVLPTPAHDHIIDCCLQIVPWYTIVVLNFDPNIMPNPVTGQCTLVVPSNLTLPTANCLNSFQNLVTALTTNSNSVSVANAKNPIWQTLGDPTTQIVIPGAATAAQINNANSNLFEHFTVNASNPYFSNNLGG